MLHTKQKLKNSVKDIRSTLSNQQHSNTFVFPKIPSIGVSLTSGVIAYIVLTNNKVFCQQKKSRISDYRDDSNKDTKFDWKLFWSYLRPHILYFFAAIVVSIL